MKTTALFAVLGVSLFLGGCGASLQPGLGGPHAGVSLPIEHRDATLDNNAAVKPLALPKRFIK